VAFRQPVVAAVAAIQQEQVLS